MKKTIYTLILLLIWLNSHSQALHLVVVADVTDKSFGAASARDITVVEEVFKEAAVQIDFKFLPIFLTNNAFSTVSLKNTISNLKPQPNDIIVFFYSGSGFYPENSPSEFPTFKFSDLPSNALSMDEVGDLLNKKGARFSFVMADCRDLSTLNDSDSDGLVESEKFTKLAYKKLFLEPCGLLKMTSAKKGEKVLINTFTFGLDAFFKSLLQFSDIDDIDKLSFQNTEFVQGTMDFRLKETTKTQQTITTKQVACTSTQQNIAKKFPSYVNAPTTRRVNISISKALTSTDLTERTNAINSLRNSFTKDARITVFTTKVDGSDSPKEQVLTLDDFIKEISQNNPKMSECFIELDGLRRSPDFLKYTHANFTKILD